MIIWIVISSVLLAGYVSLMIFYFIGWKRTLVFARNKKLKPQTKVSIIIAARNEEETIGNCILSLLQQDYPRELYEIIVIDDHSEDKTLETLLSFKSVQLKILQLSNLAQSGNSFKKQAIELGIRNSTGALIVTTDADCLAENKWLSTIVSYYENHHPMMMASPVAFAGESSSLEKWQSLDLCGMMTITTGAITNGFPNMCNGANLAYEKKIFTEIKGFSGIDKQPSGDDVLLMQKISKRYPGKVHFLKSREAIVFTQPVKSISELFHQRLRWLSKGTVFPDRRVSTVLVLSWVFNFSIVVNLTLGIIYKQLLLVAFVTFFLKTFAEFPLLWSGCSFFGKKNLLWNVLPAQIIHILYVVIIGGASRFYKYQWKGREYSKSISLGS